MVAFGGGGVMVEALDDASFRAAPMTALEAGEMIQETSASRLVDGFRGLPPVDREGLVRLLVRVGRFASRTPALRELDLNPVIAGGREIVLADVRVVLED
jgi:acyl-CoA synthetase (NDP forming)